MNCKVTILHPIRFSINNNINKNSILESLRSLLVLIFRLFEIAVFISKVKTRALGKAKLNHSWINLTNWHSSIYLHSLTHIFFYFFYRLYFSSVRKIVSWFVTYFCSCWSLYQLAIEGTVGQVTKLSDAIIMLSS